MTSDQQRPLFGRSLRTQRESKESSSPLPPRAATPLRPDRRTPKDGWLYDPYQRCGGLHSFVAVAHERCRPIGGGDQSAGLRKMDHTMRDVEPSTARLAGSG